MYLFDNNLIIQLIMEDFKLKKVIFIIVRYSVLMKSKAWNIAKEGDFEDYREKLFSKVRLNQHFFLFQNFTLPSVACQVHKNKESCDFEVKMLLITSNQLPEISKIELSKEIERYDWIDTIYMDVSGNLNREINGYIKEAIAGQKTAFATVRLDDDDALHSSFLSNLSKYLTPDFSGHVISYPKGYAVLYDQDVGKISSAIEVHYPKIALGLSLINFYSDKNDAYFHNSTNIFQAGKHTTVQERYPLVVDESLSAYVRMCYKSSDTSEAFYKKRKKISPEVSIEEAFSGFDVNPIVLVKS